MNDIFSSLVFEVKFDRSRKLSVEMGKDEKNGWVGRVDGVGRLLACRVISKRSNAKRRIHSVVGFDKSGRPSKVI
jgi:hypothetical protein